MKYYEFTEQEILDIRDYLPVDIAFGFLSYGRWFVSSEEIENIDNTHAKLLTLAIETLFSPQDRETLLASKESDSYERYILQKEKNADGFDAYEKIIGYLVSVNGLGATLDNDIVPNYNLFTNLRMMLKDGVFEIALRYWATDIKPLSILSVESAVYIEDIIVQLCKAYGTNDTTIGAFIGLPKGSL